jgi:polar amino acid transport system substrate-binding protein
VLTVKQTRFFESMRIFSSAAICAAAVVVVAQPSQGRALDEIKSSGTIQIVTTSQNPPHGYFDPKTQQPAGAIVDICNALAKHLGVKPQYTEVPFGSLIGTLTGGRADLMCAPLFITDERKKVMDFSGPLYGWGEGLAVNDSNTKSYPDLNSLAGSSVGVLVASTFYKMLQGIPGVKDIHTYDNYIDLLADLQAKRIEVAVVDPPSIRYIMRTKGITGIKLVDGYHPVTHFEIGLVAQKGNDALIRAIDDQIAKMKSDGELKAILDRWNLGEYIAK